jgi:hypothetical protein
MKMLPKDLLSLMLPFAALVSNRVWQRVMILVVGAILAPGKRTVSAILRVMGFEQDRSGGDSKPQTIIAMELQPLPYL